MSVNDPISDMLTRIRNAGMARKAEVTMPSTKVLVAIAKILRKRATSPIIEVIEKRPQNQLKVTLRYGADKRHTIREIKRVSKPGLRVYAGKDAIPRVKSGLGHRDRQHPAGRDDRVRGSAARNRRRGALHRLLVLRSEARAAARRRNDDMSRIGRRPITVPAASTSSIGDDNASPSRARRASCRRVSTQTCRSSRENGTIIVERPNDEREQPLAARSDPDPDQQHGGRRDRRLPQEPGDPGRRLPRRAWTARCWCSTSAIRTRCG